MNDSTREMYAVRREPSATGHDNGCARSEHGPALQHAPGAGTHVALGSRCEGAPAPERAAEWLRCALEQEREEHRRTRLELQNMRRTLRLTEARLGTGRERDGRLTH